MTITGGIKFFNKNLADSLTGAVATATTGDPSAGFILDRNQYTVWRSVGSDDTTTETIIITLADAETFSRLFLINHNFKEYTVKYWDGISAYIDFSNILGINAATGSVISEDDYALSSSYYEFDEITTTKIQISVLKTQVVDDEKFLNLFVAATEIGTLDGFPVISDMTKDKNMRKAKLLNGRVFTDKSIETMRFSVNFKNYPPTLSGDLDLVRSLFERDDSFLVWLCGGRNSTPCFKYQLPGIRIQDLIQMQTTNIFKDKYRKNFYNGSVDLKLKLEESE